MPEMLALELEKAGGLSKHFHLLAGHEDCFRHFDCLPLRTGRARSFLAPIHAVEYDSSTMGQVEMESEEWQAWFIVKNASWPICGLQIVIVPFWVPLQ